MLYTKKVFAAGHIGFLGRAGVFLFVGVLFFRLIANPSINNSNETTIGNGLAQLQTNRGGRACLFILGFFLIIYGTFAVPTHNLILMYLLMLFRMQSACISHSCCWLQVCFDVSSWPNGNVVLIQVLQWFCPPTMSEPSSTAPTSQRCAKQCSPDADPQLLQFRRVQFSAGFPDLIVNAAYVLQVLNAYGKVYPTPPPQQAAHQG